MVRSEDVALYVKAEMIVQRLQVIKENEAKKKQQKSKTYSVWRAIGRCSGPLRNQASSGYQ